MRTYSVYKYYSLALHRVSSSAKLSVNRERHFADKDMSPAGQVANYEWLLLCVFCPSHHSSDSSVGVLPSWPSTQHDCFIDHLISSVSVLWLITQGGSPSLSHLSRCLVTAPDIVLTVFTSVWGVKIVSLGGMSVLKLLSMLVWVSSITVG